MKNNDIPQKTLIQTKTDKDGKQIGLYLYMEPPKMFNEFYYKVYPVWEYINEN